VGVPATVVIAQMAILGVANGFYFSDRNWVLATTLIAASVLGVLGLIGAWLRLRHTQASLDALPDRRTRIVLLLSCGLGSAVIWILFLYFSSTWQMWSHMPWVVTVTVVAPILAVYLLLRTRKSKPNPRFESDAIQRSAVHRASQPER
jgi:cytochrome bd-type quinol oxidase subunit 2